MSQYHKDKDFTAAAYSGLLSNSHITTQIDRGVEWTMTPEEKMEIRKKNAQDVAELAIALGEVLAKKYYGEV